MDQHQEAFKEEAYELLAELESSLLELEETPNDKELIARVFLAMHTIKGSGAMFGFEEIAEFTHAVETAFDLVREGKVAVTPKLINVTLSARDQILAMLNAADGGEAADEQQAQQILALFKELVSVATQPEEQATAPISTTSASIDAVASIEEKTTTYRIHFAPVVDIFSNGTNPILLLNELREFGECNVVAHPEAIPCLEDYAPEACYTSWDIILTTSQGINEIKDVFIFVEDDCELDIQLVEEKDPFADEKAEDKKLGEILVERGDIDEKILENFLVKQEPIGKMLVKAGLTDKAEIESALAEQAQIKKIKESREKLQKESSIRVGSYKLDQLIDMVGELVTIQAGLTQKISEKNNIEFQSLGEEVERITSSLRDLSMSLRMIPIGTTFSRFKRLIRDLSQQLGKRIELVTEGAETQLDATIIERLVEPLIHLIRNSIDHGIEMPGEREKVGKSPGGTIYLSAIHSGAYVLIQVRDDGAGLDTGKLLNKAVQKGIIPSGTIPTEKEIFKLIFAPGFSTAKEVTGVSGRGVGMDVVKKTIEELGGSIDIESKRGNGTLISLKIPL
ncbi:MAG: chemotaxis protein CheA, partial [Desulfobulbaceae bacterium]|nr:chemotaxis protein CheA [Desulfobulbaceae bacterium]